MCVLYECMCLFKIFGLICSAHADATARHLACTFDKTKDSGNELDYYYFVYIMSYSRREYSNFVRLFVRHKGKQVRPYKAYIYS